MNYLKKSNCIFILIFLVPFFLIGQNLPKIISDKKIIEENYLPDFSYAGYQNGEKAIPISEGKVILATDFGVVANDDLDDTKNLIKAIAEANKVKGKVTLQLPVGRIIISDIIYIERSDFSPF